MARKDVLLTLLVALMVVPLSGCVSDGVDGPEGPEGPQGQQGMQGLNGTDGVDGLNGLNGTDGVDGLNGTNGTNGTSTLIQTFTDYPGEHCQEGGLGLHVGVDDDDDGYLSIDEIDETTYVCNGANGQDGADGNGGSSGGNSDGSSGGSSSTMLSDSIRLSKSDGCPAGGRLFAFGLDNGDQGGTAGNGVLETGEIDDQTTYCSAQRFGMVADALPGENGSKPTSYQGMKLTVEDTLYFSANDGIHGEELWAYNTTTDEMWMVADIRPGGLGSFPGYWLGIQHGSQIFFGAITDDAGHELWAHDHSTGTTWMAANLGDDQPSPSGSNPGDDMELMYGNTLYFSAFTLPIRHRIVGLQHHHGLVVVGSRHPYGQFSQPGLVHEFHPRRCDCTSRRGTSATSTTSGPTTSPTEPHGRWRPSARTPTPIQATTWIISSATPCILTHSRLWGAN